MRFIAAAKADGTIALPAWLRYRCETAETSAQASASTVRTGFAAHAPRAFSLDGVTWGLLVEPARTNIVGNQALSTWSDFFTPVIASATTPAVTTENVSVADDNAGGTERKFLDTGALSAATMTLSAWMRRVTVTGSSQLRLLLSELSGLSGGQLSISVAADDPDWVRRGASGPVAALATSFVSAIPAIGTNADTGTGWFWGMQLEARSYPTSFIGADNATFTRAAGELEADVAAFVSNGRIRGRIAFASLYADDETDADHNLVYFNDDNRLYFRKSDGAIVWIAGGEELSVIEAIARHDLLVVEFVSSQAHRSLTVNGETVYGFAVEPLDTTSIEHVGIFGATDAEEGASLFSIVTLEDLDSTGTGPAPGENKSTFVRYAAAFLRWARGRYETRLTGTLALVHDCVADAARQGARWLIPAVDTPTDALRYQLRHFGLPTYVEGYFATIARLRDYLPTLAASGGIDMLTAECVRIGLVNPTVTADSTTLEVDYAFSVYADDVGGMASYSNLEELYWGAFQYGHQLPPDTRKNLRAMLRYFRPAREFFNGVYPNPPP